MTQGPSTSNSTSGASPVVGEAGTRATLARSHRLARLTTSRGFRRFDHVLEHWSEQLSPILVKEARQALKSRRFLYTFFAIILAGWIWSLFGVSIQAGASMREATGEILLAGYVVILALPLTIMIPFSAFYSLSRECQNGAFELTSLTRMSALHIVLGKLGSVLLQIGVYFSALVPFIALAYLLRGVDLTTILFLLLMNLLISLSLSCLAILLATTSTNTLSALGGTVITAAGCVIVGLVWAFPMQLELLDNRVAVNEGPFWSMTISSCGVALAAGCVVIMAAAAVLDFPSKNRSTPVRWAILVLLAALATWTITAWVATGAEECFTAGLLMAAFAFMLIGAVINSENPDLSSRAQRALPTTTLGRMWLIWLNPGSATGYVFVVLCCVSFVMATLLAGGLQGMFDVGSNLQRMDSRYVLACFVVTVQLTFYLGVGRLLLLAARLWVRVGPLASLLLHGMLLIAGCVLPYTLEALLFRRVGDGGSLIQSLNWAWSISSVVDGRGDGLGVILVASPLAVAVFVINLMLAASTLRKRRVAPPLRVQQDELERHPPPPPRPSSPFE